MSGKELRVPDYLGHMIEAIDRIATYIDGMSRDAFGASNLVVDAVIHNIEIVGEASNKVLKHDPRLCPRTLRYRGSSATRCEASWRTTTSRSTSISSGPQLRMIFL